MNTKITKIGVFTLGLLALGLLLNTKTGNVSAGTLDLQVTGGNLTCTQLSSGLNLTYVSASFDTQVKSGSLGAFSCTDLKGEAWNNAVTIASNSLTAGSYSITGISFELGTTTMTSGSCTFTSGAANTYTNINTSAGGTAAHIFKKTETGAVCQLDVATSDIKVSIPASQPVGTYQATLTVTYPS